MNKLMKLFLMSLMLFLLGAGNSYATLYDRGDAEGYNDAKHTTGEWQKLGKNWDSEYFQDDDQLGDNGLDDGLVWSTDMTNWGHNEVSVGDTVYFKFEMYRATTGAHEYDQLKVWIDKGQDGVFDNPTAYSANNWIDNSTTFNSNVTFDGNTLQEGYDEYKGGTGDLDFVYGVKWYKGETYGIDNGHASGYEDAAEYFIFSMLFPETMTGDFWLRARVSCTHTSFEDVNPYDTLWQGEVEDWKITVNPVPEPATMLLLGSGLVGLAGFRKKFKKA